MSNVLLQVILKNYLGNGNVTKQTTVQTGRRGRNIYLQSLEKETQVTVTYHSY